MDLRNKLHNYIVDHSQSELEESDWVQDSDSELLAQMNVSGTIHSREEIDLYLSSDSSDESDEEYYSHTDNRWYLDSTNFPAASSDAQNEQLDQKEVANHAPYGQDVE